jgi:cyclic lactone autoinducer peptide
VVINGYFIVAILLTAIGGLSINGYCWLFYYRPLVIILIVVIDGYFIGGYEWLFC